MHIDITGRHVEITPALRKYAEARLKKLERLLDGPIEAHVVLAVEKHRHLAEVQIKCRTALLSGAKETEDLYASLNEVAERLERQALRHKEKLKERKKRDRRKAASGAEEAPAPRGKRAKQRSDDDGAPRIVPSARYRLKPLSPEDAALELDASKDDLLVYRDATTYRVNVVFRRKDGRFGLIDPEF